MAVKGTHHHRNLGGGGDGEQYADPTSNISFGSSSSSSSSSTAAGDDGDSNSRFLRDRLALLDTKGTGRDNQQQQHAVRRPSPPIAHDSTAHSDRTFISGLDASSSSALLGDAAKANHSRAAPSSDPFATFSLGTIGGRLRALQQQRREADARRNDSEPIVRANSSSSC